LCSAAAGYPRAAQPAVQVQAPGTCRPAMHVPGGRLGSEHAAEYPGTFVPLGVVCCGCGAPGFRLLVSANQAKTVVREKEYQARVFRVRSIDSIAEDYVERAAALDPALATFAGIA
jgi:hypothetical protein